MASQTGKAVYTLGPIERLLRNGHQAPSQSTVQDAQKTASLPKPPKNGFQWTGFTGKTLWDWLGFLGTVAIPIAVVFVSVWYTNQQCHDLQIAHDQQQQTVASNLDQQQQATYDTYLDRMSDLITTQKLQDSKPDDEVRALAHARTIATLEVLDPLRKGHLLVFLQEAKLIQTPSPIIDLVQADLRGADLHGVDLTGADLRGAILDHTDLDGADLRGVEYISNQQLESTSSLHGAIMPDSSRHP